MNSSDFRQEARKKLEGKWGKAVCIMLAYFVIFFILSLIDRSFSSDDGQSIFSLIITIIELPLTFGLIISLFNLYKNEAVKAFDFFSSAFDNFEKAWGIAFQTFFKMIVPAILMIISYALVIAGLITTTASALYDVSVTDNFSILAVLGGILLIVSAIWGATKSYYYKLAYIVSADHPELTSKEAVLKSEELMQGNRFNLFCLELSFIGWAILATFTAGIGYLWLIPYIRFAIIAFYKNLVEDNETLKTEKITEDKNVSNNLNISEDLENPIKEN